jgi:hypothetical protein
MIRLLRTLAIGAIIASATAPAMAQVYVNTAPPAPIYEAQPVAPGNGYAWVPGHYRWEGNQYVWVHGHYMRPPQSGQVWVPGHWVQSPNGRYHWREGHWRTV